MIGTSLGPYKIIEQLGAGGMGEVYLGEDTRLGRKVAIKVLPAESASVGETVPKTTADVSWLFSLWSLKATAIYPTNGTLSLVF